MAPVLAKKTSFGQHSLRLEHRPYLRRGLNNRARGASSHVNSLFLLMVE
jgi:hypothetical protein